jgi:alcohol dehydrogenase class IV
MFQVSRIPYLHFGAGARHNLIAICKKYGKNLLLVTGKSSFDNSSIGIELSNQLHREEFNIERCSIANEPSANDIDSIVGFVKKKKIHCVVSIGGGSVIDAGKAVSAMIPVDGGIEDYLEGIGLKNHSGEKIPFIAMPTTSGTGSEATKNAVISKLGENGYKKSLRHNNFIPEYAIIDPEFTLDCPPDITASTGMDAFTQLVESFLSTQSNVFTDNLALDGIRRIIHSLEKAVVQGNDIEARENIAYAAYLSGVTLANAGLGVIHGFAQPLGSMFSIPHGVVCGTLMGISNRITYEKAFRDNQYVSIQQKYHQLGNLLSDNNKPENLAYQFINYLESLTQRLKIKYLSEYGIKESDLKNVARQTGLKNHPVSLSEEDLLVILKSRL